MKAVTIYLLLALTTMGCTNNTETNELPFTSTAKIIGLDQAECVCCGDWLIEIDNDQTRYQFKKLPENTTIDLQNTQFPISVKLNWKLDEDTCFPHIIIEQIELN